MVWCTLRVLFDVFTLFVLIINKLINAAGVFDFRLIDCVVNTRRT